jgi:hypothetical protein
MCVFGIVGGLAVVASRVLPRWMGWVLVAGIWLTVRGLPRVREAEPEVSLAHVLGRVTSAG